MHWNAERINRDRDEKFDGFGNRGAEAVAPRYFWPTVQVKLLVDTFAASEFDRSS
jgi:hypothetical protein